MTNPATPETTPSATTISAETAVEYHCVMTIQSIWNGEPRSAVTHTAYLTGETAAELYGKMHTKAMHWWASENPGRSMGKPVVLHWSFTKNAL